MSSAGTIFIVDDDDAVRDSARMLLESYDFAVRDFPSAKALLGDGDINSCDCLLLDLHMPEMNGLELLEELRQRGFESPAILITGKGDPQLSQRLKQAQCHIALQKPVRSDDLLQAILHARANGGA